MTRKVLCIFGTRPEAIKMAPVIWNLRRSRDFRVRTLATAQHRHMLDQVLAVFRLKPDHDLSLMHENQSLDYVAGEGVKRVGRVLDEIGRAHV